MANLQTMAENQRTGTPHSQELFDFINEAVNWEEESMCGGKTYSNLAGWYLRLYFDAYAGLEYDPTIADVHTQPTDEGGGDVGRILHELLDMKRGFSISPFDKVLDVFGDGTFFAISTAGHTIIGGGVASAAAVACPVGTDAHRIDKTEIL